MANADWNPYLREVRPSKLNNPIWLKRDCLKDVIFDILKGDISHPLWFVRSHTLMFVQTFVFSMIWIFLGASLVYLVSHVIFKKSNMLDEPFGRGELGGFLAASSAIYWNIAKRYGDQWTYCAGVFNKIFCDKFPSERPLEHLYRKATFAIDLIDCSLWHHRSFMTDFNYILECAIRYQFRLEMGANEEIAKYERSEKKISDARKAIADFQNALEAHLQHLALVEAVTKPQASHSRSSKAQKGDSVA